MTGSRLVEGGKLTITISWLQRYPDDSWTREPIPSDDAWMSNGGIKVYSGCGDGVSVWSVGGILLGKIIVPGGVANFSFGRSGEHFLLNEAKFWVVMVGKDVKGALLARMSVDADAK